MGIEIAEFFVLIGVGAGYVALMLIYDKLGAAKKKQ